MLMLMSSQVALSVLMQVLTSLETLLVLALGLVLEQEQELVMSVFEPAWRCLPLLCPCAIHHHLLLWYIHRLKPRKCFLGVYLFNRSEGI